MPNFSLPGQLSHRLALDGKGAAGSCIRAVLQQYARGSDTDRGRLAERFRFSSGLRENELNCPRELQTVTLGEFQAIADTYYPGDFSVRPILTVGSSLEIGLREGSLFPGSEVVLDFDLVN